MTPLLVYLVKVIICSGILYAYYYAVLRNNRFHRWNRYYLLLCTLLSLIVPLLRIPLPFTHTGPETIYVYTSQVVTLREQVLTPSGRALMTSISWSSWIYGFIFFLLLLRLTVSYLKIISLVRSSRVEFLKPYWLVLSEKIAAPFSFFRYIFWNSRLSAETSEGRQILRHEMVHLQEKHSTDKLFMEVVTAACWVNPFFHLIKRELSMIHEFIADKKAVVNGDVAEYAQSILQMALESKHSFSITNSFSHQPIKRRIFMLTQSRTLRFSYLRRLLILPLAVLIFCSLAFVVNEKQTEKAGPAAAAIVPEKKTAAPRDTTPKPMKSVVVVGYGPQKPPPPPPGKANGFSGKSISRVVVFDAAQDTTVLEEIFTFVEQPPTYPGGEEALARYLNKNIRYPKEASANNIMGTIFVSFVVSEKGAIRNAKTVGAPKGGGLEEEAVRVVNSMPAWKPGKQNNRPVSVQFNLPIRFVLAKDTTPHKVSDKGIYSVADEMPAYTGGEEALTLYLRSNLRYPPAARSGKVQGQVIVSFIVRENGSLDAIRAISQQLGGGLEEEAMRVVKSMPAWKPARDNGKYVPAEVHLPIAFRLE